MTQRQIQQIRESALRYLEAAGPRGLPEDVLRETIKDEGLPNLGNEEFYGHMIYLQGAGFVAQMPNAMNPAITRWKLTNAGVDHLAAKQPRP